MSTTTVEAREQDTDFSQPSSRPATQANSSPRAAVADKIGQSVNQAKEAGGSLISKAKDQATSRIDQQRETIANGFQGVARAFRTLGEDLRTKEEGPVAGYAAQIGDAIGSQVDKVSEYLRSRDIHQIVTETGEFAKRSPALFLGGAFVLGFGITRFLKSSRQHTNNVSSAPGKSDGMDPAGGI